jgi:hypothetical protein
VPDVHVDVAIEYQRSENTARSGRVLTIDDETVIDASPRSTTEGKLAEIELFIDQVLASYAGH